MSQQEPPGSDDGACVRAWIEANLNRLPDRYSEFTAHSMPYRQAIFAELSPAQRRGLWQEHFARYRNAHPGLTPEQRRVLGRAERLIADESTLAESRTTPDPELDQLKDDTIAAYGFAEARNLIATLGPPENAAD